MRPSYDRTTAASRDAAVKHAQNLFKDQHVLYGGNKATKASFEDEVGLRFLNLADHALEDMPLAMRRFKDVTVVLPKASDFCIPGRVPSQDAAIKRRSGLLYAKRGARCRHFGNRDAIFSTTEVIDGTTKVARCVLAEVYELGFCHLSGLKLEDTWKRTHDPESDEEDEADITDTDDDSDYVPTSEARNGSRPSVAEDGSRACASSSRSTDAHGARHRKGSILWAHDMRDIKPRVRGSSAVDPITVSSSPSPSASSSDVEFVEDNKQDSHSIQQEEGGRGDNDNWDRKPQVPVLGGPRRDPGDETLQEARNTFEFYRHLDPVHKSERHKRECEAAYGYRIDNVEDAVASAFPHAALRYKNVVRVMCKTLPPRNRGSYARWLNAFTYELTGVRCQEAHEKGWPTVLISFRRVTEETDDESIKVCIVGNCLYHDEKSKSGCSVSGTRLELVHDSVDEETLKQVKMVEWKKPYKETKVSKKQKRLRRRMASPLH